MTLYKGERTPEGCTVTADGETLNPRLDLLELSYDGYEWGETPGERPLQLALAVLAHAIGPIKAMKLYEPFHEVCISRMYGDEWVLTDHLIEEWADLYDVYLETVKKIEEEGKVTKIPSFRSPEDYHE